MRKIELEKEKIKLQDQRREFTKLLRVDARFEHLVGKINESVELISQQKPLINKTNIIKKREIPNMILTGTPGTGKTTTLLCLMYKLYGPYIKDAVLELNASDDRGIQSINTNVINFCNYLLPYKGEDVPYAQHKLVIFDEADNMGDKTLPIISSLLDRYSKTCRFVFI